MGYIYKIVNKINNKVYIGQTVNKDLRWKQHIRNDGKNPNLLIGKAFNKYGIENFEYIIIEECENCNMSEREKYWIKHYDSYNSGYNMTIGGEALFGENNPFYGKTHTIETKEKLSLLASQRIGNKNPFYGKHHSEETLELMRKVHKGVKPSEETKKKMSEAQKGEKNHFYGKHHSKETKKKLSETRRDKTPLIAYNDTEKLTFTDRKEAYEYFKSDSKYESFRSGISRSIKNKTKYLNYYWIKSVETIPDECKEVESEISTDSKCTASKGEEIVHTIGNNG